MKPVGGKPERSTEHESKTISKTDLRQVPGYQAQRRRHGYLREPEAQTETGMITTKSAAGYGE